MDSAVRAPTGLDSHRGSRASQTHLYIYIYIYVYIYIYILSGLAHAAEPFLAFLMVVCLEALSLAWRHKARWEGGGEQVRLCNAPGWKWRGTSTIVESWHMF